MSAQVEIPNAVRRLAALIAWILSSLLLATAAQADLPVGHDQRGWDHTAVIARAALAADEAGRRRFTTDQWEDLRLTLTIERQLALDKAEQGSLDTRILSAQLAGLGPEPANAAREAPWISRRRDQLNAVLATAETPLLAAREAHARAGVLIADVTRVIDRQSRAELLGRVDSVLGPAFWRTFGNDLSTASLSAAPATPTAPGAPGARWDTPSTYASIAIGLAAVFAAIFAHRWVFALERKRHPSPRGHLGFALLKDFSDIALPMLVILLALALLDAAADRLAIPPGLETAVIEAGAVAIYFHWLGRSVFLPTFEPGRVIAVPERSARRAIVMSTILGLFLAADSLVDYAEDLHAVPATFLTLASLAVIVGSSLCTWSINRIVHSARPVHEPAAEKRATGSPFDLVWPLSRLVTFASLMTPLVALVGYVVLARGFLTSSIYSVAAICVALFLFRSITGAADILFDRLEFRKSPSWQFVPLVFGFLLVLVTAPLVLLLWGVSSTTIVDWIFALKNGVQIGEVHVSFGNMFTFGVVFLIGYFLTRWLQRVVQIALFPRLRLDAGGKSAILTAVGYVGLTLSAMLAITAAGLDLTSLAFVAGALSVGVGFGLQSIVSNFVSGLILLVERPVREGDWIEVGAISGHVRRIAFRSTHLETFDHHEVIIPNSELISGSVKNLTYGGREGRIALPVGIAYASDIEKAKSALLAIAEGHASVLAEPAPSITMNGFGENAVDLTLLCFVDDVNRQASVRSDLYFATFQTFRDEGIEIPFPQRDVRIRRV